MATVSITIPDALIPRVTAAMRGSFPQYAGLTDVACFKQVTADYWRGVLAGYEAVNALETAKNDAAGIG